jgi:hypothetical protein
MADTSPRKRVSCPLLGSRLVCPFQPRPQLSNFQCFALLPPTAFPLLGAVVCWRGRRPLKVCASGVRRLKRSRAGMAGFSPSPASRALGSHEFQSARRAGCVMHTWENGRMVEPVSAAVALGKLVDSAADETGKQIPGLLARVLGPTADEIGRALGQYTASRLRNMGKITEIADKKASALSRDGIVNPRVAYTLLEDGSFCDDEVMVDYLGGVLAAGRTPTGRDDRAVTWSNLITSMSALELRAHFILYREWAHGLHQREELELTTDTSPAFICVDLDEFVDILSEASTDVPPDAIVSHVLAGLLRRFMIGDDYSVGVIENLRKLRPDLPENVPFRQVFCASPTISGIELFGWACGLPGLHPSDFVMSPEVIETAVPVPRPTALFPRLQKSGADSAQDGGT